ncbi:MAG: DMT family transporter [Bacillota bacterium]
MKTVVLFCLSILWGSTFYFTKLLLPDFHPVSIVFYRCLFGAIALLPLFLWKKKKEDFHNFRALLLITLISAGIPWTIMSFSLKGLDTTIGAVLNATGPVFGIVFSVILLRVKVSRKEIAGVIVGFTGILLSFFIGSAGSGYFNLSSAGFLLLAVSIYGLSAVLTGRFLSECSVFTLSFVSLAVGSIYSGITMLWVDPNSYQSLSDFQNVLYFISLGVFNSGLGNILYFYLVKKGGAIYALLITYLMPITTIFLGVIFLKEEIGIGTVIALLFVLTSVYLTGRKEGKKSGKFQQNRSKTNEKQLHG